ncbi:hypothetical protein ACOI1C_13295 [Bacillus sp. DJP31]|uniref:hypothetical protein n=1 Tax=Bacillus sp. DJP31 TaxID=3409789 RepID=UPI003BB681CD
MLNKQERLSILLFFFMCLFEVISFFMLSRVVTDTINPLHLLTIYLWPIIAIRWIQLKLGQVHYGVYALIPVVQFFLLYQVGNSYITIAAVVLFSCWRMYAHIKEPYIESQGIWLSIVLASTFGLLMVNRDFLQEYVSWFLVLLFLFLAIRILIQLRKNQWYFMKKSYQMLLLYLAISFVLIIAVFQSGLYVLRSTFPYLGQGVALLFSYPLTWLIEKFKPGDEGYKEIAASLSEIQDEPFTSVNEAQDGTFDQVMLYIFIFVIVTVVGLILYLTRKHLKEGVDGSSILLGEELSNRGSFFRPLKELKQTLYSGTGKNEVRIQFHKLQIYMKKRGKERMPSETAEEWFERIGLSDPNSLEVLKIYRQYRYGSADFKENDADLYRKGVKNIKTKFPKIGGK